MSDGVRILTGRFVSSMSILTNQVKLTARRILSLGHMCISVLLYPLTLGDLLQFFQSVPKVTSTIQPVW